MSNIRFNDKSQISNITGTEFVPITNGTDDFKASVEQLADYTGTYLTIDSLKSNVSTNTLDIESLNTLISTNANNISSLNALVSTNTLDINKLEQSIVLTPNSVNSAKTNSSGYAYFIAKVSDTSVVHYAGGSNPNIVETDVLGRTHTITADETITGMTDNGVYEMLKEYDLATGVALASAPVAVNVSGILDGTAISGGDYSGYPANNAFDGTTSTSWASSQRYTGVSGVAYIGKNFGSAKSISKILLNQNIGGNAHVTSVKVQSSTNGSTWVDVQTFNSLTIGINTLVLTNPLSTQYIRLLANSNVLGSGDGWVVYELTFNQDTVKEVQTLDTATFYDGDYRTVTGVQPNRQYKVVAGTYVETTFIRRGQVTKTAGTMGTPSSYAFGGYAVSAVGMPSSRYIDLTLGASGSTYTAPSNGYYWISKKADAVGQFANLGNSVNGYVQNYSSTAIDQINLMLPVKKGTVIFCFYSLGGATNYFRFIYAEGVN